MFCHKKFLLPGRSGLNGGSRAAPVVGPSGRGSAPPSRPNDLNSTTKITHSIFFYPSVSTFTSAASWTRFTSLFPLFISYSLKLFHYRFNYFGYRSGNWDMSTYPILLWHIVPVKYGQSFALEKFFHVVV